MAEHEGSSVRWQSIAITQLGYSLNLILTFAAASLGFALTLVKENDVTSSCWARSLLVMSGVSLLISIALGIWCVITRLIDFRKTALNARDREKMEKTPSLANEIEGRLQARRVEVKKLDERTWILFYCQVGAFCAGILALVGTFIVAYRARIF